MNNYYQYPRARRQLTPMERTIDFLEEWYDIVCLAIGSMMGAVSALMLMALGMTDIVSIVIISLAAPLLGGILAYASAAFSNYYLENWCYGVAAVIGFLSGPLAFGGFLLAIDFLMNNFI